VALEIQRDKQQVSTRRVVRGWGRIFEIPELVYELRDNGSMEVLGKLNQLEFQNMKDRAIECLTVEWQTIKEVRDLMPEPKPSIDHLTNVVNSLADVGAVERDPPISEGKKPGKTYRWRKNLTSDESSLYSGGEVGQEPDELDKPTNGDSLENNST